jgi:predicted glycosyltransferase
MAREGALLGSRSIYCGSREMKINRGLIQRGLLKKFNDDDELKKEVRLTIDKKESTESIRCRQDSIRNSLLNEWIDINKILFQEITGGLN